MLNQGIGAVVSERQKRIINWLREVETELGELYEGALRVIKDKSFPGRDRLICHAVREIRNRLPNSVAGKHAIERLSYPEEVTLIEKAWERAGLEGVYEKQSAKASNEPGQFVAREVLAVIDGLMRRHKEVKNRKEENARRLLVALEPENEQLRSSLTPVVKKWIDETEWFVARAHVGKAVDEDELAAHFETFEVVLGTFARYFYEVFEEIEKLVKEANASDGKPSNDEVTAVIVRLGRAKYRIHLFNKLENPHWIEALKNEGYFKSPTGKETGEYETWLGGRYLKKVASKVPDKVLEVISELKSRNPFVKITCIECLLEMPEDVAIKGIKVIENMLPQGVPEGDLGWSWTGEKAAELMVKFAAKHEDKSFKISWILLDAWVPQENNGFGYISAKFPEYGYRELVQKYFSKLWGVNAERAIKVLVKILNRCLTKLKKRSDYVVESGFHIKIERLDQIGGSFDRDIVEILVAGICEAGKAVIEKQPGRVDELLAYLWALEKTIFERIVMYLLRFVPERIQKQRISSIIGNRKFLEHRYWWYEYRLLLRDKFEDIDDEAIQVFKTWVEEKIVDEEEKKSISSWFKEREEREATGTDFEQIENSRKARELYLVKEKFPELYEKYKEKSGASDADLMPIPRIGEMRPVGPTESSPISVEEMLKIEPSDVLAYMNEPSRWEIDKKKESFFQTPEEGLSATFEKVVQQRVNDYAELSTGELNKLKPIFLKRFFHGAWNALREKQVKKETLVKILQRANNVIVEKNGSEDYEGVFRSIFYIVEGIFEDEKLRKQLVKENSKEIWGIIETLSKYEDKRDETDKDEDPHQRSINCVAGEAFTLVLRFGLSYKNEDSKTYEKEWSEKIRGVLEYVVDNVKDARIRCVIGVWFPQLHGMEKEWVEKNLDKIFNISNDKEWDAVWGTYMSWGRAYKNTFDLLAKRGKYNYAVEKIESSIYGKHDKNPDKGLVEHLMIGYFNEWIDIEDKLLKKFFETASAKLRGKAARFLTTGFKSVNEKGGEQKEKVATRMKAYWKKRLETMREKPKKNIDEAIKFTGWVKDTLIEPKETLELLEQTLDLSGGKFGQMRGVREFIGRICELGNGNELIALRCIKKAVADEHIREPWARYEERLIEFLEKIGALPIDYENVEDILNEAVEVADLYGRLQPDKFREIWEKLNKRLR